ncbi:porin [Halomonas sp. M4R5S39]|uniref:porin n=1 Tax=Halomonas kalidii TaxID=3043293 RepID=UPI0024A8E1B1|nr:porin [Halomonas kalidii]MDI5984540.1 porin [Halomonas kalidii]
MKKTLLATAIAGALGASAAAQAATVYDQDGTKVDLYGRIAMGISGGGPEEQDGEAKSTGTEFKDVYSRLRLSGSHQLTSDLSAFASVEWRFRGDERDQSDGFREVRHSFLGLRSDQFGTIQAGSFDSFYNTFVAAPFDVYLDRGLELSAGQGGDLQARGDSLGYFTPDLSGFQAFIMTKHYTGNGQVAGSDGSNSSELNTQGGVKYEWGGLRLAAGFAQDRDDRALSGDGDTRHNYTGRDRRGADENIYGATASYAFNDNFSARLGYETQDTNDGAIDAGGDVEQYSGYDTWGLGASYSLGAWAFHADVYRVDLDNAEEERIAWAAGAYYKVSSNFDVFGELHRADQGDITVSTDDGVEVDENDDSVYWLVGARYHF